MLYTPFKYAYHRLVGRSLQLDSDVPTGTPLTGASRGYARGYEKMTIFDEYLALSQVAQ